MFDFDKNDGSKTYLFRRKDAFVLLPTLVDIPRRVNVEDTAIRLPASRGHLGLDKSPVAALIQLNGGLPLYC